MSEFATFPTRRKSQFERWRIRATFLVAPLWAAILLATQAEGFETYIYELIELSGFFLIFVAVLGRLWCTLYIGGRKDAVLCQSGPYSMCRNPLYLFSFIGVIGVCLAAQNPMLTLITAAIFLAYYLIVIRKEEERLESIFGAAFTDYRRRVPSFLPRLRGLESEEMVEVKVRVFTRALGDVMWFLMAIIFIEVIEDLRTGGFLTGWILPV